MSARIITITDDDNDVPADADARLRAVLDKLVARSRVRHANLAIATGDGTRHWSAAAGPGDPADSDDAPLRPDTPFFVASITKQFIVTLVLQAHERGELDLDARLTAYLPPEVTDGLHVLRGTDHSSEITIRHLASHTSGLPDFFDKPRTGEGLYEQLAAGRDRSWTFEDVLQMVRTQHRPHFEPQDLTAPRQKARYSDTGFQLLIRTVETVTSRSYAQLLTERIIRPLGLARTWLPGRSEPAEASGAPSPLYTRDRRVQLPSMIESSNDLISTTGDLLVFHRALLAGELFTDPRTVALLTERRNRLRNIPMIRYGLGTMIFPVMRIAAPGRRPVTLIGHSGATGTWLFHCPELDLHLAGTVDQTTGQAIPFNLMARLLRAW